MSNQPTDPPNEPGKEEKGVPAAPSIHLQETHDFHAADASVVVQILDQFLEQRKRGEVVNKDDLIAKHPQYAAQLEACLAGLEFLQGVEKGSVDGPLQRLGDFQILREVGRGGMGAVFEATQISLGRRVALKVLKFGGVSDPDAVERFQREAETIAKLHHTNIVPIFAVGCERGVNYYAMQFIEGESLAEVFAKRKKSLDYSQVAEWGLQAAEALAHAHQRGVIHRDVKPSNLILDKEKRLWLTDFGLARRTGDVTLSLTGALLGTPRYMSPEQAAATHKKVDHRSDIFSLGTTLYELLVGSPAFPGDSPHDVIQKIIGTEPIPIRQALPQIPRDLETIIHKCLAKEPAKRYLSAQELANDLRAFLEGRPILARRASLVERAGGWLKQQQRSVQLTAVAVAATVLVMVSGTLGLTSYQRWQRAYVKFETPTAPMVAEILDTNGEVIRGETVPTQQPISLPAGDYSVRGTREGTLGRTWDLELPRGRTVASQLDLRSQGLTGQIAVERSYVTADLGKESAIVLLNKEGLGLRRAEGSALGWEVKISSQSSPLMEKFPGFRWGWNSGTESYSGYDTHDLRPWVVEKAGDLNGDGTGDLILAGRHQAWLLAISGSDGRVLWFEGRGTDLEVAPPKDVYYPRYLVTSSVMRLPVSVPDQDGDELNDLVVMCADLRTEQAYREDPKSAKRWIELISSKTGKSLWRYDLPSNWIDPAPGERIPMAMRWFCLSSSGMVNYGGGDWMVGQRHRSSQVPVLERNGDHLYCPDLQVIKVDGLQRLAVVAREQLQLFDLASGKVVGEREKLPLLVGYPARWADCDGDGVLDLVMLDGPMPNANPRMAVWSLREKKILWERDMVASWPRIANWTVPIPQWPLVEDLDGDGACEVLVPDGGSGISSPFLAHTQPPWGRLVALSGKNGEVRWLQRLTCIDQQINRFVVGQDIDQDGTRDVHVATLAGSDCKGYVDTLSGKTGEAIWTTTIAPRFSNDISSRVDVLPLQWWHKRGANESPLLVVHVVEARFGGDISRSMVCTIDPFTGQIEQMGPQISGVEPLDFDHDGAEELCVFSSKSPNARDWGGSLHVLRGTGEEAWRRFTGMAARSVADFNGDGVEDLVQDFGGASAIDGLTGRRLWTVSTPSDLQELQLKSLEANSKNGKGVVLPDLDGDGTADLFGWGRGHGLDKVAPYMAISGKTGKPLWRAKEIACQTVGTVLLAEAYDLQGAKKPDVVIVASLDYGYPESKSFSIHESQLWAFVVDGRNGKLKWSHALSPAFGQGNYGNFQMLINNFSLRMSVGDLNQDGTADLIVPGIGVDGNQVESVAIDGQKGSSLWRRPVFMDPNRIRFLGNWVPPAICDLQRDGNVEVAFCEFPVNAGNAGGDLQVVVVDGKLGKEQWTWNSAGVLPKSGGGGGINYVPSAFSISDLLRPVVIKEREKGDKLGFFVPSSTCRVVVLDKDRNAVDCAIPIQAMATGLWPCDLQGDGTDELVFMQDSQIVACGQDDLRKPIWKHVISSAGYYRLFPRSASGMQTLPNQIAVVGPGTDNSVEGLDLTTGKLIWTSPGPITRDDDGTYLTPQTIEVLEGTEVPWVFYALQAEAFCQRAVAIKDSAKDAREPRVLKTKEVSERNARTRQASMRWKRTLPWVVAFSDQRFSWKFLGLGVLFAASLVVAPGWYVGRILLKRQFSLKMLLLLPVVVGFVLATATMTLPNMVEFRNLSQRWGMGIAFSPIVVGLLFLGGLFVNWEKKRVLRWGVVAIFWSLAVVVMGVVSDNLWLPLMPEETYDWSGWYWAVGIGFYLTCVTILFVVPFAFVVQKVIQLRSRSVRGVS
ncbi:MAG: protein kinase [Pirellulales bacterium]